MIDIDIKWSLKEIAEMNPFTAIGKYFIYCGCKGESTILYSKLSDIHKLGWDSSAIIRGLNRIQEIGDISNNIHYIYSVEECEDDPSKKDVNVTFFPAKTADKKKDVIIIVPGGAYISVCSAGEGYPVAAKMNELGYSTFVLNYRVNEEGILPKPIDDLAAALRYIFNNAETFDVNPERYVICGFSAGGHLVSEWGTDNHGYSTYGFPKPTAIFLAYPEVSMDMFYPLYEKAFLLTMLGNEQSKERKKEYSVEKNMSNKYPPCYVCLCKDDDIVPVENSIALCSKLRENKVECVLELCQQGGHGFGEGQDTDAYGWINRAIDFYESKCASN